MPKRRCLAPCSSFSYPPTPPLATLNGLHELFEAKSDHIERLQAVEDDTDAEADAAEASEAEANTQHLVQFISQLGTRILALCVSLVNSVRGACAQILLECSSSAWVNPVESMLQVILLYLYPAEVPNVREMAYAALEYTF